MERIDPRSRRDQFGSKINRDHSPPLALSVPWLVVMLFSLTPFLPVIAPAPVLPPFGFLALLSWRFLRPGLLPLWAGLPLGLFDDLFSGQPLGSAILLYSIALVVIEVLESRFPWRNFIIDWLAAAVLTLGYLLVSALISGGSILSMRPAVLAPQILVSILLFPLVARIIAAFDRLRLMRVRRIV